MPAPARAFPAAVTTAIGVAGFATRYAQVDTDHGFGSSLVISAHGDYPLTRRLGLLAEVMVAPLAKQRAEHPDFGRVVRDKIIIFGAHAGIGGRLKPGAPVFLEVGGGVSVATKHALPDADGQPVEPHAGFTIGYDASPFGRSNFRISYSGRVTAVATPDAADLEARSMAYDQVIRIGLRFVPSRAPALRGRP